MIVDQDDPDFSSVPALFDQMYLEMQEFGLMLPLVANGADKWIRSVKATINRTSCLGVAVMGTGAIGFAHGALRFSPDYLGGKLTGVVTHIYVGKTHRGAGVAQRMLLLLEDWFNKKKVDSVDLQVVNNNLPAHCFWEKAGYDVELLQYRKFLK